MKYILIKKSQATRALINLSDSEEEMLTLRIPNSNESAATNELNNIDNENWTSSDTYDETNGNTSNGILLPKKAINA